MTVFKDSTKNSPVSDDSIELARKQASRCFWRFAACWFAIWTILPAWLMPSPGTYDVIEQFLLGREWVLGSIHHPPLPFWTLEIVYQLSGRSIVSAYICGALTSILGLWVVWRLSRYYLSETLALVVVLASAAYRYFNMGNVNYTSSTLPVAIWCLSIFLFFRSIKYGHLRDWLWLGIALGAGMMSKYSLGILVVTMILYLCWDRDVRRLWTTPGPWLTSSVAILLFMPHLIWLIHHDFPTIRNAANSLVEPGSPWNHIITPLRFLGAQIFLILPMLIPLVPLLGFFWQLKYRQPDAESSDYHDDRFRGRFLNFMIFVPLAIQLALFAFCGGGRMRPAYGSPLWTLIVLWFVQTFQLVPDRGAVKKAVALALVILSVTVLAFWADYQFRYFFTKDPCRAHFPGKTIANALDYAWSKEFNLPCPCLSGDWKVAGHAALYMEGRPSVLCYYHGLEPDKIPDGFWLCDDDLKRTGGIIVWRAGTGLPPDDIPEYLASRFPGAQVRPGIIAAPWLTRAAVEPLRLRYAIIPPGKQD